MSLPHHASPQKVTNCRSQSTINVNNNSLNSSPALIAHDEEQSNRRHRRRRAGKVNLNHKAHIFALTDANTLPSRAPVRAVQWNLLLTLQAERTELIACTYMTSLLYLNALS